MRVVGGEMRAVSVPEKDTDHRKAFPELMLHEFCRIGEGADPFATDHISLGGQLLHRLADRLAADAELLRQFKNRRNLHRLPVGFEDQPVNVLPDLPVFRCWIFLHCHFLL